MRKEYFKLSVNIGKVTIVDIETTGFSPIEDELTAIGIISKNTMIILLRGKKDRDKWFRKIAKSELTKYSDVRAAYYKDFEENWLDLDFTIELQPEPYQKKIHVINTPVTFGNGAHCASCFPDDLEYIRSHLIADMLDELALYCMMKPREIGRFDLSRYRIKGRV